MLQVFSRFEFAGYASSMTIRDIPVFVDQQDGEMTVGEQGGTVAVAKAEQGGEEPIAIDSGEGVPQFAGQRDACDGFRNRRRAARFSSDRL